MGAAGVWDMAIPEPVAWGSVGSRCTDGHRTVTLVLPGDGAATSALSPRSSGSAMGAEDMGRVQRWWEGDEADDAGVGEQVCGSPWQPLGSVVGSCLLSCEA